MFGLPKSFGIRGGKGGRKPIRSVKRCEQGSLSCVKLSPDTIVITIPLLTPSLNETLNTHWSQRYKLKNRWAWFIRAARLNGNVEPPHWPKAHLRIMRVGGQMLDFDNLAGGMKSVLIDNLRNDGWIEDDSPQHITVDYLQSTGSPHKTEITITHVHRGTIRG